MEDPFTVYMHLNGRVLISQSGFRKYMNGTILRFKDIDPDKWSKEEATGLLKDIGIFDVDEVFYTVTGVNFDEGLRDFKSDTDALKICDFASKGHAIHVYVTHSKVRSTQDVPSAENVPLAEKIVEFPVRITDDDNISESVVLNHDANANLRGNEKVVLGLGDHEVREVVMTMESRLEERIVESDSDDYDNEDVEENDDNEELPDMYDPDYGDPSGEGLWNIFVHHEDTICGTVGHHEEHNLNSSANRTNCDVIPQHDYTTEYGRTPRYNGVSMSFFGHEVEDISDSDGEGPQETYIDTESESETEGEDTMPKKKKRIEFRRQTDINNPRFIVGMIFKDHKEFVEAVNNYKISNNYNVKAKKQESKRVLYRCVPPCPWKLYASWNNEINAMQVKTFKDVHDCSKAYHSRMVSCRWVAIKMMDKIRRDPHYKINEIIEDIKEHYEVEISVSKATRARKLARLMVSGSFEEQYMRVRDYGYELLRTNPGSTVRYDLVNPTRHFKRMYICLAACKKAFLLHCRHVISVDACHLRGPISGQLLSAVGIDANDGMYPIAFAVAESETKDTWTWFFNNLLQDIGLANGWIFYSDQQKGLMPALSDVFPGARHKLCVRHLYANFKKKYPGLVLKELMEQAARETTKVGFEKKMEEIKLVDRYAEQHLRGIDPQYWCKHTFSAYPKCDMLLNNLAECFNSKIIKARDKPVITCMETIRRYIMGRIHRNRDAMAKYNGPICPRIQDKLEKNKKESLKGTPAWNGLNKYEVSRGKQSYVVDMKNRTCRCYKWDITGIPCEHACSAIFKMNELCEDYVDHYLSKEAFLRTYSVYVEPVNGDEFWSDAGGLPILPPKFRTQPGRPKLNKRKRDVDEPPNPTKLSKKHTKIFCSKCGNDGHNKRTCKSQQNDSQQEEPRAGDENAQAKSAQVDSNNDTNRKDKSTKKHTKKASKGNSSRNTAPCNPEASKTNKQFNESDKTKQNGHSGITESVGGSNKTTLCMGFRVPTDKRQRRYNKQPPMANNLSHVEQGQGRGSTTLL